MDNTSQPIIPIRKDRKIKFMVVKVMDNSTHIYEFHILFSFFVGSNFIIYCSSFSTVSE